MSFLQTKDFFMFLNEIMQVVFLKLAVSTSDNDIIGLAVNC